MAVGGSTNPLRQQMINMMYLVLTALLALNVSADIPTDCSFWLEDDGWNGVCEELSITVRGSSFEDAKRKMEAALQAHIESVLSQHSRASRKKVA